MHLCQASYSAVTVLLPEYWVYMRVSGPYEVAMFDVTAPSAENCNCYAVRAAARHVTQYYDQFLAPTGLRISQFGILTRLKGFGTLTISELAEKMAMDRTTLGRNIQPLQRDGLVDITPTASDRRAKEIRLTAAGTERLEAARKGWQMAQAHFETSFGPDRAAELRGLLRTVTAMETPPTAHATEYL
jgi:DNA-binding MarR family transcriptional regulator